MVLIVSQCNNCGFMYSGTATLCTQCNSTDLVTLKGQGVVMPKAGETLQAALTRHFSELQDQALAAEKEEAAKATAAAEKPGDKGKKADKPK